MIYGKILVTYLLNLTTEICAHLGGSVALRLWQEIVPQTLTLQVDHLKILTSKSKWYKDHSLLQARATTTYTF
jgi:hypothetical protein